MDSSEKNSLTLGKRKREDEAVPRGVPFGNLQHHLNSDLFVVLSQLLFQWPEMLVVLIVEYIPENDNEIAESDYERTQPLAMFDVRKRDVAPFDTSNESHCSDCFKDLTNNKAEWTCIVCGLLRCMKCRTEGWYIHGRYSTFIIL